MIKYCVVEELVFPCNKAIQINNTNGCFDSASSRRILLIQLDEINIGSKLMSMLCCSRRVLYPLLLVVPKPSRRPIAQD